MIPWRANQVFAAFALSMAGVWAATGALVKVQAPLWAVVAGLSFAAMVIFTATLAAALGGSLYHNRIRRAVQGGNREAASLCAAYLRRGLDDEAVFSDDPSARALEVLRRDLEWAGVRASVAEVRQYLLISRWAGAGRDRSSVGRCRQGDGRSYRVPRVRTAAAGF